MVLSLHARAWWIGLGMVAVVAVLAGLVLFRGMPSEAYPNMPAEQQAYWTWVRSIQAAPADALSMGTALLTTYPDLPPLYVRLASLCAAEAEDAPCREALAAAQPTDAIAQQYQAAGHILLMPPDDEARHPAWQALAGTPHLAPPLARLIIDQGRRDRQTDRISPVAEIWEANLAADSSNIGAAFGLGYLANLRRDWGTAEPLLQHAARLDPDEPEVYRELGRIYALTGQTEAFEQTLRRGIEAAQRRHDLEQQLIASGNLAWGLFQKTDDLDKVEALLHDAIAQSRRLADGEIEGFNLYRLTMVRLRQGRFQEALTLADEADSLFVQHLPRRHPELQTLKGQAYNALFQYSKAEQIYEGVIQNGLEVNNLSAVLQARLALAQLRYQMGRYLPAREVGIEALKMAQQYSLVDHEIVALKTLGNIEYRFGNFEAAQQHYLAGLEAAQKAERAERIIELYDRLGRTALKVQNLNGAQFYFEQMLATVPAEGQATDRAQAYLDLGRTYQGFQNHAEALRYFDLAEAQLAGEPSTVLANVLLFKAWTLLDMATADSVRQDALALLDRAEALVAEAPAHQYNIEAARGALHLSLNAPDAALVHLARAEELEKRLQWPTMQWQMEYTKALSHWALGDLQAAEAAFEESIFVIEALRENLSASEQRSFFIQNKVPVYKNLARLLASQGRTEESFHYTERARSRSLVDLLYTTQRARALDESRAEDRIVEAQRNVQALEERLAALEAGLTAPDLAMADIPGQQLRGLTRRSQLLREYLRADSMYLQAQIPISGRGELYSFDPVTTDSAQSILRPGEAMVVYNLQQPTGPIGPEATSSLYIVLPDTVLTEALDVTPDALFQSIRFFRDQISNSNKGPGQDWEPAARRLYDDLVAPALTGLPEGIRHLHIVPEGMLYYLPFAALRSPEGRFLVEDYTLSVAPSASILKISRDNNPGKWRSMLLFADPAGVLPGSRREALDIASRSPNRRVAFVGEQASQANLMALAKDYDIIHLATHGQFTPREPWRSVLELNEGMLGVEEIGALQLDAYLITLSACETALSGGVVADIPNGDEWVGLNQAFLAAGAPTVMASLWPIDDRVSSDFMIGFYDALGPQGKAEALAAMQRRFMYHSATQHPFYWAAFTVIGDPL